MIIEEILDEYHKIYNECFFYPGQLIIGSNEYLKLIDHILKQQCANEITYEKKELPYFYGMKVVISDKPGFSFGLTHDQALKVELKRFMENKTNGNI